MKSLVVFPIAIDKDPNFMDGGRCARKLAVVGLFARTESEATESVWSHDSGENGRCPVIVTGGGATPFEVAVFTHGAKEDRHYHRVGTEIYTVLDGTMTIWIDGETYHVPAGGIVIVAPNAVHEVLHTQAFRASVINIGGGGPEDKFVVN